MWCLKPRTKSEIEREDGTAMAKRARPNKRRGVWLITGTLLVTAGVGGYFVYDTLKNKLNPVQCTATQTGGDNVALQVSGLDHAPTILAPALGRRLPRQAPPAAFGPPPPDADLPHPTPRRPPSP